jgi:DNA-binding transcriptional ArsR family regulator
MPKRQIVAKELAAVLRVIAHPDRIRIIEELRAGECDVNSLVETLELPGPRVSQHLGLMRLHAIVAERRDGRRHFYSLVHPEIAAWIVEGLNFIEGRITGLKPSDIKTARRLWSDDMRGSAKN